MIIKTGLAKDHLVYGVDIFDKDTRDGYFHGFDSFQEFKEFVEEKTFDNTDNLECVISLCEEQNNQYIKSFEAFREFKNGKISHPFSGTLLDSFMDTINMYGFDDEIITQGLFEFKNSDDFKNFQKFRYNHTNREIVCNNCFEPLSNCKCGKADAGKALIIKDFRKFFKDVVAKNKGDYQYKDSYAVCDIYDKKIEWTYSVEFNVTFDTYQKIMKTFPRNKHVKCLIDFKKKEIIRFAINCSGRNEEKLLQSKEKYFSMFNEWVETNKETLAMSWKPFDNVASKKDKKFVYVCPQCFEERSKCICDTTKDFIEIDKNIYPVIRNLNRAGFHTSFCCEGHNNEKQGYIHFTHFYHFEHIPEFCSYSNNYNLTFNYDETNDAKEFEKEKKQKMETLLKWSEELLK